MRPRPRALSGLVLAAALLAPTACSGGDGGGSVEALCAAVRDGEDLAVDVFGDFDPTDTDRALDQLRIARMQLDQLHDVAPGEVRGALTTEIDYVQALIDGLESVPEDDAEAAVAVVNGLDDLRARVELAAVELADFEAKECASLDRP